MAGVWITDSGEKRISGTTIADLSHDGMLSLTVLGKQHKDLGFQLLSWLEVVAQHADEQKADCNHAAMMF